MNHKGLKKTALFLAGVLAVGSLNITAGATGTMGISSVLPAAGMALTMSEGSSASDLKATTKNSKDTASKGGSGTTAATGKTSDTTPKDKSGSTGRSAESGSGDTKSQTSKDSSKNTGADQVASLSEGVSVTDITGPNTEPDSSQGPSSEGNVFESLIHNSELTEGAVLDAIMGSREAEEDIAAEQQNGETAEDSEESDEKEDGLTDEERAFKNLVIAKVTNYVNIRDTSSEEGEVVGKLYDKSVGEFIEEENGWYKIKSGSVTGYVKAEFCVTGEEAVDLAKKVGTRIAIVNTTTLKVRNEASTESPVLGLVPIEEELTVVEELEEWVKVDIEEGYGFVSKEYVNLRTDFVKAESIAEERARLEKEEKARREAQEATKRAQKQSSSSSKKKSSSGSSSGSGSAPAPVTSAAGSSMGQQVVNYAMQFVGNPYVYGGTSLTNGADCSGFVMSVYKNFGVSLPHSSSADRSQGYNVGSLANAQPGDLVCYSGHVGIYAGNGQIVHASTAKTGIKVSNANYRQVVAVRRIFQ